MRTLEPEAVTAEKLVEEASSWGMQGDVAAEIVHNCLEQLEADLETAAALYPNGAARHETHVRQRIARMKR